MSKLQKSLEEYLTMRRSLGFDLNRAGKQLHHFVSFLTKQGDSYITTDTALSWIRQQDHVRPRTRAQRLGIVRCFAQYMTAIDSRTEVPPQGLCPYVRYRKPPYIYTDAEIEQLLQAAKNSLSRNELVGESYSTLLGLLVVTGMRISECLALNDSDVDLAEGILTIERTKFKKSRMIPLHPSTQEKLRQYIQRRNRFFPTPKTPSFFVAERGGRTQYMSVHHVFVRLSHQIGLRKQGDRHGPRLHDFRHRFAVKTLMDWYRDGIDVERHIAELSTYLGHVHVSDTYWYLTGTPELLQLAAKRLEKGELSE